MDSTNHGWAATKGITNNTAMNKFGIFFLGSTNQDAFINSSFKALANTGIHTIAYQIIDLRPVHANQINATISKASVGVGR
jgi:hypothetical protein